MNNNDAITERKLKLQQLKVLLKKTNDKLMLLEKTFNWNFEKLSEEPSSMVTCSINCQHQVPLPKVKIHEAKCSWRHEGYTDDDKTFSEHSGTGSFVTLTPELIHSITKNVPSFTVFFYLVIFILMEFKKSLWQCYFGPEKKGLRAVPQTSANFDQNFDREEKLAIYDYVIANTKKQVSHSDLWLQPTEKTKEKKEMAAWEIAAAERDAKRRRASYRNKVHTNRKTQTEILREVIETQMEALKEEISAEKEEKIERHKTATKKSSPEPKESSCIRKLNETNTWRSREGRDRRRHHDKHSKRKDNKKHPLDAGSETKSRSRSYDKYRKWKNYEGRSHSHRSSHAHTRK